MRVAVWLGMYAMAMGFFILLTACTPTPEPVATPPALVTKVPPAPATVTSVPLSEPEHIAAADDTSPMAARKYQAMLTRNARVIWGLDAPIPMFGAQVQQESGWKKNARSPVGAQGIAQFMPATADWIDDIYPDLGPAQPYNPAWALRALTQYDKYLFDRVTGASECDRFAFALSSYNGGLKWVQRDKEKAKAAGLDPLRYWSNVESVNNGRSAAAWNENRGYPKRILRTLQPKYETWGRSVCK